MANLSIGSLRLDAIDPAVLMGSQLVRAFARLLCDDEAHKGSWLLAGYCTDPSAHFSEKTRMCFHLDGRGSNVCSLYGKT